MSLRDLFKIMLLAISGLNSATASGQVPHIRNLALEGGGLRGVCYMGALDTLSKRGALDSLHNVAGTSAGGLVATMLALGYSTGEMVDLTQRIRFHKLNDNNFFFISGSNRLLRKYGWYRGKRLVKELKKMIAAKTGNADITFGELHALHLMQPQRYKDLTLVVTNMNEQKAELINWETYPDCPVYLGVRASMSIPLYFAAVSVDAQGREVKKPKLAKHVWVDGGVLMNYPIMVFRAHDGGSGTELLPGTWGLRLDDSLQMAMDRVGNYRLMPRKMRNFGQYAIGMYQLVLETINRSPLTTEEQQHTISINIEGINGLIRRLRHSEMEEMMNRGRQGAAEWLSSFEQKP